MISFAIQHHPKRSDLAAALVAAIGGEVDVVADPFPHDPLPSPWRSYRHVLCETPDVVTHRVVLQDDAVVCDGFRDAAEAAVAARPGSLIAFFVAGHPTPCAHRIYAAAARGEQWACIGNDYHAPLVALAWPEPLICPFLKWADAQAFSPQMRCDDHIVGVWTRAARELVWATVPSLVQHDNMIPSLIGQRSGVHDPGREAACWIGSCDAASIDWTPVVRRPQDPARLFSRA